MNLSKLTEKVAHVCGFNTGVKIDGGMSDQDINNLINVDREGFQKILPYRSYDEQTGIFYNDSSIGFAFEIVPLAGADESIIASLSATFKDKIQDQVEVQFVTWSHNKLGPILDQMRDRQSKLGGKYKILAEYSAKYLKHALKNGFYNKTNLPMALRDYRCFLFLSKKIDDQSFTFSDLMKKGFNFIKSEILSDDSGISEFIQFKKDLITDLSACDISVFQMQKDEFIQLIKDWINLDHQNIYPSSFQENDFNQFEELNKLLVDPSLNLSVHEDHLEHSIESRVSQSKVKNHIVNLSVSEYPDYFALWKVPDLYTNVIKQRKSITCPFLFSVSFRMREHLSAQKKAKKKCAEADKKAKSQSAKDFTGIHEAASEWRKIRDDLNNDEVRLVDAFVNLTLFTIGENEQDRKEQEAAAKGVMRVAKLTEQGSGFEMGNVAYLQFQSYLSILPFMVSEGIFDDLKRMKRTNILTTWNLASILPIISDFKGGFEGLVMPTQRHQMFALDIHDPRMPVDNYNGCIAAKSGSGKSFLAQALIMQVLSRGGKVWVIDVGDSYRKFAQLVDGTYLNFSNLSLNPFSHIENFSDSKEQIRDLLAVMASPNDNLCAVSQAQLMEAVERAWEKTGKETLIDDVIEHLSIICLEKEKDIRVDDLATLLKKFRSDTPQGKIFNDRSKLNPESDFVVIELGELDKQPTVLKCVLFSVILFIQNQMYGLDPSIPKLCVIDEAWRLLKGNNILAANFIEQGYRTARKYFGSFISITQSVKDFESKVGESNPASEAAWNNSSYKIIMRQDRKDLEEFGDFDEVQKSFIKRFKPSKLTGFSEFMLQMEGLYSFNRLLIDPLSRIMYSSHAQHVSSVNQYQRNGLSLGEAIKKVAYEVFEQEMKALDDEQD